MLSAACRALTSVRSMQKEIMDGVVSLEKAGVLVRLHDRRIDHASVSSACDDIATGTIRGNVSLWPRRLLHDKASEGGIIDKFAAGGADASKEVGDKDSHGEFGASLFRVKKQPFDAMRASTVLTDQDLDIVDSKDVKLNRHLGNGAFGTVREGVLHHTTVAVKILKEGEFRGALGSLVQAGDADREDIRRGLVRVRTHQPCHAPAALQQHSRAARGLPVECSFTPNPVAHAFALRPDQRAGIGGAPAAGGAAACVSQYRNRA